MIEAESEDAYPLQWPVIYPRCSPHARRRSTFKVSFAQARNALVHELRLLGAARVVVSTNIKLKRDGLPIADYREPDDPGVAVYWTDEKRVRKGIGVDGYLTVRENMRAAGNAVEALRVLKRSGALQVVDRMFDGLALPERAGTAQDPPWWETLRLQSTATPEEIRASFRELVRIHHPDRGGSDDEWNRLNRAYAAAPVGTSKP